MVPSNQAAKSEISQGREASVPGELQGIGYPALPFFE